MQVYSGISVTATLGTTAQPSKATRVCMMCDRYVGSRDKQCMVCGSDTEKIHTTTITQTQVSRLLKKYL